MLPSYYLRRVITTNTPPIVKQWRGFAGICGVRNRLSRMFIPTNINIKANSNCSNSAQPEGFTRLLQAGYLQQAHPGTFHLLPLGLKVQQKLEVLIDKYMEEIDASRVDMSSITSETLWERSGRLASLGPDLFHFQDRKGMRYLLGPTHEEEVTNLVAKTVSSYKRLPVRLYQITSKFRDEPRPRYGLLRSREFTMKDLYTFDLFEEEALKTYHKVQEAYHGFFTELGLPYMVAEASSGDMGGDLSHEFHLPCSLGEDIVIRCNQCNYTVNREVAEAKFDRNVQPAEVEGSKVHVWRGVTYDRNTLINVWYVSPTEDDRLINLQAVKMVVSDLDTAVNSGALHWMEKIRSINHTDSQPLRIINLVDFRLKGKFAKQLKDIPSLSVPHPTREYFADSASSAPTINVSHIGTDNTGTPLNLLHVRDGDACPKCNEGLLSEIKSLELGHTFHLGTRYSKPLQASVMVGKKGSSESMVNFQMGCHGIGVTRLIGAIAETMSSQEGLCWPIPIAPFHIVIIAGDDLNEEVNHLYDALRNLRLDNGEVADKIIDDRPLSLPWKLKDAELLGIPIKIVLGKYWRQEGRYEIQVDKSKHTILPGELESFLKPLLKNK